MFIINLYRFLFGTVVVKITGGKPERFISALINLQIQFWDVKKRGDYMLFTTSSKFAREDMLKEIARRSRVGCEVEIIKRKGIRWFLERHKQRLGLYIGIVAGISLIYASTFFIWEVRIADSNYPNDDEIIELLSRLGVRNGALIRNIEPSEIQSLAILANPNISWIAVNIKGTIANIEVRRLEEPIQIVDTQTPTNIIAARSGRIVYIDVYDGEQIVQINDSVQKGELMISGAIDSEVLGIRLTHAAGRILAETSRTVEIKIPTVTTRKEHTERIVNRNKLNIFGRNVNLYLVGGTSMEKYDRIRSTENVTLFGRIMLPMRIFRTQYIEFEQREVTLSEEEANQVALATFERIITDKFGSGDDGDIIEIIGKSYTSEMREGYYFLTGVVDLIENIAREVEFEADFEIYHPNAADEIDGE